MCFESEFNFEITFETRGKFYGAERLSSKDNAENPEL
jgi:hypothetical protein